MYVEAWLQRTIADAMKPAEEVAPVADWVALGKIADPEEGELVVDEADLGRLLVGDVVIALRQPLDRR